MKRKTKKKDKSEAVTLEKIKAFVHAAKTHEYGDVFYFSNAGVYTWCYSCSECVKLG